MVERVQEQENEDGKATWMRTQDAGFIKEYNWTDFQELYLL